MKRRNVALLIESSRGYGRGLLRGIAGYARAHTHWSLLHSERRLDDDAPSWLKKVSVDGVIARIESPALLRSLRHLKVPIVDVRGLRRSAGIPRVGTDHQKIAKLAADHLLDRGFRHIGFCGLSRVDYSIVRREFFVAALREKAIEPHIYEGAVAARNADTTQRESEAMLHERELAVWLSSLPKPAGVMACNDIRGRQVLSACRARGIAVPDEVAVVGVDDDEVLCELSDPPLSSVALGTERIGQEAAVILDRIMNGARLAPDIEVLLEPLGVVTRLSSDVIAVADRDVADAVRFIRERACEGIGVEQLLDHLAAGGDSHAISRSTLERRFAETLGRSPKEEIMRVRLGRARELLLDTDLTLADVAASVGIEAGHLIAVFKSKTGETPGAFRKRMGGAGRTADR